MSCWKGLSLDVLMWEKNSLELKKGFCVLRNMELVKGLLLLPGKVHCEISMTSVQELTPTVLKRVAEVQDKVILPLPWLVAPSNSERNQLIWS